MSGNNESSLVQKEVEGDLSFENVVDIWLNADRYSESNNKEDYNAESKTEVMNYESDKTKRCADVLVNLTNINTDSSETERKDKIKKSADAVIATKSIKNHAKDCKSNKARNDKNKKKATKKESTVVPMKCLGKGRTFIKMCVYKAIKWDSYTKATRQLLMELFPRTVLATHSLSGKKSPAFQNRPAKQCLDANIISDIIETVCRKSDVKENLVRNAITIKCADEAKMLRQREVKNKKGADNNSRLKEYNNVSQTEYDTKREKLLSQENQGHLSDQQYQKHVSDQQNQEHVSVLQNQGHVSVQQNQGHVSVQQNQGYVSVQQNQGHVTVLQNQGHVSVQQNQGHVLVQKNEEHFSDQQNQGHVSIQQNQGHVSIQQNQGHVPVQHKREHQEDLTDQEHFCKELRLVPRKLSNED